MLGEVPCCRSRRISGLSKANGLSWPLLVLRSPLPRQTVWQGYLGPREDSIYTCIIDLESGISSAWLHQANTLLEQRSMYAALVWIVQRLTRLTT